MNTPWDIQTVTLNNFPYDEHSMIYTFRNFEWTFLAMNTPWYIQSGTLNNFSSDEHSMRYTNRNFK